MAAPSLATRLENVQTTINTLIENKIARIEAWGVSTYYHDLRTLQAEEQGLLARIGRQSRGMLVRADVR
ncbi:MAG TPA: hypothetical protein VM431_11790 [Phycisphaerae bacterium]|nr:hypothetical protein [Phycisphaerae bacterium]